MLFGFTSTSAGWKESVQMMEQDTLSDGVILECLKGLGISLLGEWDVLVFLYRHQSSLASAEQIARLVGYPSEAVSQALDKLESRKLIERSRSSQGARFYQFVSSQEHLASESCFRRLITVAENRTGRLMLAKHLRQNVG
jgi:DNA-binding MarR family transcriptional regulator